MGYDTTRNTAQPAFQAGRNPSTAPIMSAAVQNPGLPPGVGGGGGMSPPALALGPQAGSVAPPEGFPQGAFAPGQQTLPWAQGGNPVMQQNLMQQVPSLGATSPSGAFGGGSVPSSLLSSPMGRFGT